jgi:tetratricopeptide (TPR) repeat protein
VETQVTTLLERAQALLDVNRPDAATLAATSALAADPGEFHCHAVLARCQLAAGQPQHALQTAQSAIRIDPAQAGPYLTASRASSALDLFDESVSYAREAVRLLPADAFARARLAAALAQRDAGRSLLGVLRVKGLREAASQAQQAILLAPDEHVGHFAAGFVAMGTRRRRAARKHFRRALALSPDHVGTLNNLAALDLNGVRLGRSGTGFAEALALDPTFGLARANVSLHICGQLVVAQILGWLAFLAFLAHAATLPLVPYPLAWTQRCSVAAVLFAGYLLLLLAAYRRQAPGIRAFGRRLFLVRRGLWLVGIVDLAMMGCFWLGTLGSGRAAIDVYRLGLLGIPAAAVPIAALVRDAKREAKRAR